MTVRCKFKVTNVSAAPNGEAQIALQPVYSGSTENEQFFRYTPGGWISIGTVNAEAAKQFEVGKEFYVDFTPAITAKQEQ